MKSAGIVGATGYTGVELMRILSSHPGVDLRVVTSRAEQGRPVSAVFPGLRGHVALEYAAPDTDALRGVDVVFFATPNGTAMTQVPALLEAGVRVVDVSADFRLRDAGLWEKWYGQPHACPELLGEAVYGLPELNREAIRGARLIANPGCYPTAVCLAHLPVIEAGAADLDALIADAKSGVSGAGRKAELGLLFSEAGESFKAYGADGHRHQPEIRQLLEAVAGAPVNLTFVPHLVPMTRGIHATVYFTLNHAVDGQRLFEEYYVREPFVDVLPPGSHPSTGAVRGSNVCRIAVHAPQPGRLVVLSVIDNLVKGAAGQAVQNMNLMLGLDETAGLGSAAMFP